MTEIYLHRRCRACSGALLEFLNLGALRLNAFPALPTDAEQIPQVPLILTRCQDCGLVQLDRTVPPDWLYRAYWYRSGVNEMMVAELQDVVSNACVRISDQGGTVADIGANDGTLLGNYAPGVTTIAWEPALNLQERLRLVADTIYPDYFPSHVEEWRGQCRVVTAIACAYDAEDPRAFFQAIHDLLAPGGVAIVQFQDFAAQLISSAFDNVCHEHLEYYTLWSLCHLLNRVGLLVQTVQTRAINGGSLRVILRRREDQFLSDASVAAQLSYEASLGLDTPTIRGGHSLAFAQFQRHVTAAQRQIQSLVQHALEDGRVIDVYGASTKGNILLQVLGLGPKEIRWAIDRSPEKVGQYTITGIPIVDEGRAKTEPADLWLCPIWQFRESVLRRERWYLRQGGTILFPLPQAEVVRESWQPPADPRQSDR